MKTIRSHIITIAMLMVMPTGSVHGQTALEVVKRVADKVIRESRFEFEIVPQNSVLGIQVVDFNNAFDPVEEKRYVALSYLSLEKDQRVSLGFSYAGRIKIRIDDELTFQGVHRNLKQPEEISYNRFVFPDTLIVQLSKGEHKIMIESMPGPELPVIILRALAGTGEEDRGVTFSLRSIAPQLELNTWLFIQIPISREEIEKNRYLILDPNVKKYYFSESGISAWRVSSEKLLLQLSIPPENSYMRDSYLDWHYANGATMLGILALGDYSNEIRYIDFVRKYCDFVLEHEPYFKWQYHYLHAFRGSYHRIFRRTMLDDTGAPALPFIEIYKKEEIAAYRCLVDSIAVYVMERQVRLGDGTLCRPEPVAYTVWSDDLFMSVPFLLRMAGITGCHKFYEDAAKQIVQFASYLYEPDTRIYHHGWFSTDRENTCIYWGRANGWVIWAMTEALLYLPETHPEYDSILTLFKEHVSGLVALQDPGGMWHQVLDHPESYEETSCTAMFVLGLARGVRYGWIESSYKENAMRGWRALIRKIDADGTVHGICRGTGIGEDLAFYMNRETFDHDPRGLGAVIIAGLEIMQLK